VCDVEGKDVVNECTAQQWFTWFASGNLSLEDEQCPGRPRIWDNEATKKLLNSSHQQVRADYQTHLSSQRVLFIAT
jgi:hypothetical protein